MRSHIHYAKVSLQAAGTVVEVIILKYDIWATVNCIISLRSSVMLHHNHDIPTEIFDPIGVLWSRAQAFVTSTRQVLLNLIEASNRSPAQNQPGPFIWVLICFPPATSIKRLSVLKSIDISPDIWGSVSAETEWTCTKNKPSHIEGMCSPPPWRQSLRTRCYRVSLV